MLVRSSADLEGLDGLIIPGGESTTMLKLLREESLMGPLREFGRRRPIFGTCAGAILLANEVSSPAQESLGLIDIGVERNAYGRQIDSLVTSVTPEAEFQSRTEPGDMEAVFIRAPIIRRVGKGARVLARYAAIRSWWRRAGTWSPPSIRSFPATVASTSCFCKN